MTTHNQPLSGVSPDGIFLVACHRPRYQVANLRPTEIHKELGRLADGTPWDNRTNFPADDIQVPEADWIYEIPNQFPFRGTTYIGKSWADAIADAPDRIRQPRPPAISFHHYLKGQGIADQKSAIAQLPPTLQLALASTSTDPDDLISLVAECCTIIHEKGRPVGLRLQEINGEKKPLIHRKDLFEALVNNPHLPAAYKEIMVLRPGIQGTSEIVGDWQDNTAGNNSHIYEYLRRNSYIPWGHFAANMADDSIRYAIADLDHRELAGLRHLYYQRTYCRIAEYLGLTVGRRRNLSRHQLERLRQQIHRRQDQLAGLDFNATLWGWNYGFDFASSGYRLHASHQQIHQQYALIRRAVPMADNPHAWLPSYACGDLVAQFCAAYRRRTDRSFFSCLLAALKNNSRVDGHPNRPRSLIVYEDDRVLLFVPKAQTSKWELQLMPRRAVGNILEADTDTRNALDHAMFLAMQALTGLGARMISTIEFAKRFDDPRRDQHLLYSFLPKLPQSMGAFSEAQLRFINGHYPEDFAQACREQLAA